MALLHDPSILILDDTTSALDARTESRIQQTLDRVMKGRTTFVITHRISTAMRAEQVLVLDNGRMAGWGKHEDLMREGGVYRQIYEQQQAQAEDALLQKETEKLSSRNFKTASQTVASSRRWRRVSSFPLYFLIQRSQPMQERL